MDTRKISKDGVIMEKVLFLYRYEDRRYGYRSVKIEELKFKVIRETPKGYWIKRSPNRNTFFHFEINGGEKDRWVSKTAFKRYAYPTKEEAMVNFRARKYAQIKILEDQLEQAKNAFNQVKKGSVLFESIETFLKYEDVEI
jgi:hypothetical protein